MKTVASNTHEVFHAWANQSQSIMRCGNVSFNDGTLCSYAVPIAKIYNDTEGEQIYVVSRYGYSVTTSSHQSAALQAIPRNATVLTVESRLSDHGSLESLLRVEIEGHVMTKRLLKIKRSRTYQNSLYAELVRDLERYRDIVRRAGLSLAVPETPTLEGLSGLADNIIRQRKEAERLAVIKREKAQAELLVEFQNKLTLWLAGEGDVYLPGPGHQYLRVRPGDPETVETNRGAMVPLRDVRLLAPSILSYIRNGGTYEYETGKPWKIGAFELLRITEDVTVIGCHTFDNSEILRFAETLGL